MSRYRNWTITPTWGGGAGVALLAGGHYRFVLDASATAYERRARRSFPISFTGGGLTAGFGGRFRLPRIGGTFATSEMPASQHAPVWHWADDCHISEFAGTGYVFDVSAAVAYGGGLQLLVFGVFGHVGPPSPTLIVDFIQFCLRPSDARSRDLLRGLRNLGAAVALVSGSSLGLGASGSVLRGLWVT